MPARRLADGHPVELPLKGAIAELAGRRSKAAEGGEESLISTKEVGCACGMSPGASPVKPFDSFTSAPPRKPASDRSLRPTVDFTLALAVVTLCEKSLTAKVCYLSLLMEDKIGVN